MQIIIFDNINDYKIDTINLDNYDLEGDDREHVMDIITETVTEYIDSMDQDGD